MIIHLSIFIGFFLKKIVGAPIDCPRIPDPPIEEIQKYHKMYVDGLQSLFDEYKDKLAADRKSDLQLIE